MKDLLGVALRFLRVVFVAMLFAGALLSLANGLDGKREKDTP